VLSPTRDRTVALARGLLILRKSKEDSEEISIFVKSYYKLNRRHLFSLWLPDTPWESDIHESLGGDWKGFKEGGWKCRYKGVVLLTFITILQECRDRDTIDELLEWMEVKHISMSTEQKPSSFR
jgi:hypothetical protein